MATATATAPTLGMTTALARLGLQRGKGWPRSQVRVIGGDLGGFSPLSVFTGRSLSSLPLPPPPSSSLPQSPPSSPSLPCPQPPLASPRLTQLPPVSHSLPLPPPADTRLLTAAMALPHHRRALVPHVSETKPLNPWRIGWARDLFLLRTDGKTEARFLSERLPPLTSHLPLPTPKG